MIDDDYYSNLHDQRVMNFENEVEYYEMQRKDELIEWEQELQDISDGLLDTWSNLVFDELLFAEYEKNLKNPITNISTELQGLIDGFDQFYKDLEQFKKQQKSYEAQKARFG